MNYVCHTGTLPADALSALQADFDTLKPSEYKDGQYRLRRYSKLNYNRDTRAVTPQYGSTFVQSADLNKFQGNVVRQYDDLTEDMFQNPRFADILATFAEQGDLPTDSTIEVHQMRIVAKSATEPTLTTPEGIHQDGFKRIGMFTVNRHKVQGGELSIYDACDESGLQQTLASNTGVYCVMDDSHLWHYASPIIAESGDEQGYWDLLVLTANG